jgi:hypothetical protein
MSTSPPRLVSTPIEVAVAPGDGIGPEIMDAVLQVFDAVGAPIRPRFVEMGRSVYERGLSIGLLLLIVGVVLAIYGFIHWGSSDFGALDARDAIRLAIPAATLSVLGFQTIMGSFFLSVLGLSRR